MTTTIPAHFDGKHSLVLDQPVDLPVGAPLLLTVEIAESGNVKTSDQPRLVGALKGKIRIADDFNEPLELGRGKRF